MNKPMIFLMGEVNLKCSDIAFIIIIIIITEPTHNKSYSGKYC